MLVAGKTDYCLIMLQQGMLKVLVIAIIRVIIIMIIIILQLGMLVSLK